MKISTPKNRFCYLNLPVTLLLGLIKTLVLSVADLSKSANYASRAENR